MLCSSIMPLQPIFTLYSPPHNESTWYAAPPPPSLYSFPSCSLSPRSLAPLSSLPCSPDSSPRLSSPPPHTHALPPPPLSTLNTPPTPPIPLTLSTCRQNPLTRPSPPLPELVSETSQRLGIIRCTPPHLLLTLKPSLSGGHPWTIPYPLGGGASASSAQPQSTRLYLSQSASQLLPRGAREEVGGSPTHSIPSLSLPLPLPPSPSPSPSLSPTPSL